MANTFNILPKELIFLLQLHPFCHPHLCLLNSSSSFTKSENKTGKEEEEEGKKIACFS
jgi:hypothetical protein